MVEHTFGSQSTELKLSIVEKYLAAYMSALRHRFGELWYIDAFAGTGHRSIKHKARAEDMLGPAEAERIERRRGSARIALEVTPPFDRIIFAETKPSFRKTLEDLCQQHQGRDITILPDDANIAILSQLAIGNWAGRRAVMFLDPYGMAVDWSTLEAVAKTRAIDVWYLVSLEGLFRQATHDPEKLTDEKRRALTRMLGTGDWEAAWYPEITKTDMFGHYIEEKRRRANVTDMEQFVFDRLDSIFAKVLPPLRLHNNNNVPTFALYFAISNDEPRAIGLATRIAGHILKAEGI